jgi:5-dehydro-2-deoxygluconokinase
MLLQGITQNRYVVFGRAGMDLFADPIGVKSEDAKVFRAGLGGSSANIAVGLCKLGAQAALVTSISDDAVGRFCRNQLVQYGVDPTYVKRVAGECRTSLALYESRIEDFQNVLYRNNAADFQVTNSDVEAVAFKEFGTLVTTGTAFAAEPSRSAHFHAFARAKAAGLPIILDIDYRPYSWSSRETASAILNRAGHMSDMIVGNDEEFDFMAGGEGLGLGKAKELSRTMERIVIYKMGAKGAITFAHGTTIRTGIYPVEAVKPNGAGDSFMAGLLVGLAEKRSLREAILRGSACASIVVSKPGCAPAMPNTEALDAFIAWHPGPQED